MLTLKTNRWRNKSVSNTQLLGFESIWWCNCWFTQNGCSNLLWSIFLFSWFALAFVLNLLTVLSHLIAIQETLWNNNIKVASTFLCCWSSVSILFVRCLDEGIHAPDPPALTLKAAIQYLHMTLQLMILHHNAKFGSKRFDGLFDIASTVIFQDLNAHCDFDLEDCNRSYSACYSDK